MQQRLANSVVFGWGLGSLGLAVILNTFNVLLLPFLTITVGFDPAYAGTLILAVKVYDLLTDLPMGWLTDRTETRWGSRRPYLVAASLVTPVALVLLFTPALGDPTAWAVLALLLYATGYTLFNVPYLSMPAELSMDTHVRTRMVAWRSLFIAGGTMFGVAIAPYLVGALGSGADAYRTLGVTMGALVFAAFAGCVLLTSPARVAERGERKTSSLRQIGTLFRDRHFVALLLIKVTHLLALSIGAGSLFFFFRYALGHDLKMLGLYGAVTTTAWALAMPLWTRIARTHGKRFGYSLATLVYAAVTITWLFADFGEPRSLLFTRAVLFGVISGGMLLMGNAMLQDVMDNDYRRSGERRNGLFAGSYSLVEKLTSGIGAQVLGLILASTGFDRAASAQSDTAISGIYAVGAVIPAALMLLSLFAIRAYRLDETHLVPRST